MRFLDRLYKSPEKIIFEARLRNIDILSDLHNSIIEKFQTITGLLGEQKFYEAKGMLVGLIDFIDLLNKHVTFYFNKSVLEFLEVEITLSFNKEDMNRKKNSVLDWLNDVEASINKLVEYIDGKFEIIEVLKLFTEFQKTLTQNKSLTDFTNSSRILMMEYETHRKDRESQKDAYAYIYNSLKLNKNIKDISEKLFIEGNYNEAILRTFTFIENEVQNKSGQRNKSGTALMSEVYSSKTPILKVNDLTTRLDRNEQQGVMFLLMGAFSSFRNIRAHNIRSNNDPLSSIMILGFLNLLYEYIESSTLVID